METLHIETTKVKEIVDLTATVNTTIKKHKVNGGVCHVFLTHTTAALTTGEIGEGTEEDLLDVVEQMIPKIRFRHGHDPSHAWSHMAASILGPSLTVPIARGKLALGTWQSVLLVEMDGPREREVRVVIQGD
ncbi:MAG: secondary thiamine-phosphate synthase enzyme YjbQ [Nitrospiraceae bacterium]